MASFAVKIPFVYSCIMEFRRLGNSGLKVPVLCLGAATFGGEGEFFRAWGATDVAEATRLVDICLEAGVNLFDTADVYSQGRSEEILWQAIAGRRDKVLLSTQATLMLEQVEGNWTITAVHLDTTARVPGIDRAKFDQISADAKANCPVSRVLNAKITLDAKLES